MVPVTFNEKFNRCRSIVENRLAASPLIGSRYFSLMLSDELRQARNFLADESKVKEESFQEEQAARQSVSEATKTASVDTQSDDDDKVIAVDFATGEVK